MKIGLWLWYGHHAHRRRRLFFSVWFSYIGLVDNGKLNWISNSSKSHNVSYLCLAVDRQTIWVFSLFPHYIQPIQWNFTSADTQIRFMWHRRLATIFLCVFHMNYSIQLKQYKCNEPCLLNDNTFTMVVNCGAQFFPRYELSRQIIRFNLVIISAFNIQQQHEHEAWLNMEDQVEKLRGPMDLYTIMRLPIICKFRCLFNLRYHTIQSLIIWPIKLEIGFKIYDAETLEGFHTSTEQYSEGVFVHLIHRDGLLSDCSQTHVSSNQNTIEIVARVLFLRKKARQKQSKTPIITGITYYKSTHLYTSEIIFN